MVHAGAKLYVKGTILGYRRYVVDYWPRAAVFSPGAGGPGALGALPLGSGRPWSGALARTAMVLCRVQSASIRGVCVARRSRHFAHHLLTYPAPFHTHTPHRGRRNTYHHTSLLKLDGVNDTTSSKYYYGKKVAFIYKAQATKAGSKFRVVWGKVTTAHGSNGVVRAKFAKNLDPKTIGSSVRVMLYPNSYVPKVATA